MITKNTIWTFACDKCGKEQRNMEPNESAAKIQARANGWIIESKDNLDFQFCPECAVRMKTKQKSSYFAAIQEHPISLLMEPDEFREYVSLAAGTSIDTSVKEKAAMLEPLSIKQLTDIFYHLDIGERLYWFDNGEAILA